MVTARQRRRVVEHLKGCNVSERRACRLVGFSRSANFTPLKTRTDTALRTRLTALAERYPRYGYPTLYAMLTAEGLVVDSERTYRLYREEGLQVRTKKRKKLTLPRVPMPVPTRVNERWSVDFVSDQLANGRRFRMFNPDFDTNNPNIAISPQISLFEGVQEDKAIIEAHQTLLDRGAESKLHALESDVALTHIGQTLRKRIKAGNERHVAAPINKAAG